MTVSKFKSFLSSVNTLESVPNQVVELPVAAGKRAAPDRIRDATCETLTAEQIVRQLREMIVGPDVRLTEARFIEMLDILDEQKQGANQRFERFEAHLAEALANANTMTTVLEGQDSQLAAMNQRIDEQVQAIREEHKGVLADLRQGIEHSTESLFERFASRVVGFENKLRGEFKSLSTSFANHAVEQDKKWETERHHSLATLEQRIAQWRAELADERRQDMQQVANSVMDIGRRLLALQAQ
jgi:low affinity Fe/Cu permease